MALWISVWLLNLTPGSKVFSLLPLFLNVFKIYEEPWVRIFEQQKSYHWDSEETRSCNLRCWCNLCCCKLLWLYYLFKWLLLKSTGKHNKQGSGQKSSIWNWLHSPSSRVCHNRCPTIELLCTVCLTVVKRMIFVAAPSRWSSCMNLAERQKSPTGVGHIHLNSVTLDTLSPGIYFLNALWGCHRETGWQRKKKHHTEVLLLAGFPGPLGDAFNYEQQQNSELNYTSVMDSFEGSLFLLAKHEASEVYLRLATVNFANGTFSDFHYKGSWGLPK